MTSASRVVVALGAAGLIAMVGCSSPHRVTGAVVSTSSPTVTASAPTAAAPATTTSTVPASPAPSTSGPKKPTPPTAGTSTPILPVGVTAIPTTAPSPTPPAPPVVVSGSLTTVTQDADGQTVTVHKGDRVQVVLNSTYWQYQSTSDPSVLQQVGAPSVSPDRACIPGGGCGKNTAEFTALAPGQATVVATRTTCGEAALCTGTNGHYQVTVVVSP